MALVILVKILVSEITKIKAKADQRLGCVRNFVTRETIKSKEEVQVKSEMVQAKIVEIKGSVSGDTTVFS
jgi:hypothetical protein